MLLCCSYSKDQTRETSVSAQIMSVPWRSTLALNKAEAARLEVAHLRASCDETAKVEPANLEVTTLDLQWAEDEAAALTFKNAEAALQLPGEPLPATSKSIHARRTSLHLAPVGRSRRPVPRCQLLQLWGTPGFTPLPHLGLRFG